MQTLLIAIHGILTNQTDPSWPDKLDAWMFEHAPDIKVLKKEYRAGPFPKVNCWVKDPWLARSLANEIELFLKSSSSSSSSSSSRGAGPSGSNADLKSAVGKPDSGQVCNLQPALWFVAHSNGAVIALLTAKLLIQRGHHITGLILTGAACEPDIMKNDIQNWLGTGTLDTAIAYISPEDQALPAPSSDPFRRIYNLLAAPYGALGRTGWLYRGFPILTSDLSTEYCSHLQTRVFQGGHSAYFNPAHIESTFTQILTDIRAFSPIGVNPCWEAELRPVVEKSPVEV
jgi:hypothetical protein